MEKRERNRGNVGLGGIDDSAYAVLCCMSGDDCCAADSRIQTVYNTLV